MSSRSDDSGFFFLLIIIILLCSGHQQPSQDKPVNYRPAPILSFDRLSGQNCKSEGYLHTCTVTADLTVCKQGSFWNSTEKETRVFQIHSYFITDAVEIRVSDNSIGMYEKGGKLPIFIDYPERCTKDG